MKERRGGDERERKGKDRQGKMEEKRNAGRKTRKDARGREKGRELKGSRYASVGVGPDWARVSTRFSGAGIAGTREERKREKAAETECEGRTKKRIREILERKRV